MSRRITRCIACKKRIRDHRPHIAVVDLFTGLELPYHPEGGCLERAGRELAARIKKSERITMLRYYHRPECNAAGVDCESGCFANAA